MLLTGAASAHAAVPPPTLPARSGSVHGEFIRIGPGVRFFDVLARSPKPDAPLLVYLAGGPGASSVAPAFVGDGPWALTDPFGSGRPVVTENPWSFQRLANVVYLDQPRQTGFSDGRAPYVTSVQGAGRDFVQWLRAFDRRHPELAHRPLILAGESFAGTYVSEFSRRLLRGEAGPRSRLAGIFLEAPSLGRTDVAPAVTELDSLCAQDLVAPHACDGTVAGSLRAALDRCAAGLAPSIANASATVAIAAVTNARSRACRAYRAQITLQPRRIGEIAFGRSSGVPGPLRGVRVPMPLDGLEFPAGGLVREHVGYSPNPYDVRLRCHDSGGFPPWCYDDTKLTRLLDAPVTRRWLGGGIPADRPWLFADPRVSIATSLGRTPSNVNVARAVRAGVPVTIAVGGRDWVVNPVTARWLTDRISRAAGTGPLTASQPLLDDAGAAAGSITRSGDLTFAEVHDAGHLVGLDQPQVAFRLLERLLQPPDR
ncbi:MAG: hypothetical protein JWP17_3372 [Solirubrobacterales bacterium]|nr:hypothetical protein [Solirubrobacterales bacterium]